MKLPSLSHLRQEFTRTFLRFPFALVSAIVGSASWIAIIYNGNTDTSSPLQDVGFTGMLGISLFLSISLIVERWKASPRLSLLAGMAGIVLLVVYDVSLPPNLTDAPSLHLIRYSLFVAGLHFLVAVSPFMKRGDVNAFWQFNKSLFLRLVASAIYSGVLYVGLTVAILAVDQLFEAHIDAKIYLELWVFIVGVFNTWFFLAGVPADIDALESDTDYPGPLKVFTQYILLPLVFIYLVILYAYTTKIIATWDWPKGWVGYLVLGYSILGIFSLLLVHPIKERIGNAWIRAVSKYYYVALIPLALLLLLAIWRRISEYGLTEKRYFVLILGFWLLGMIAFFLLSKSKSIKVIPGSLCAIAFFCSFGPWGAISMSERNQVGRLEEALTRTGILREGKIHKTTQRLSFEDGRRVSAIVQYLSDVHGLSAIQPWFNVQLDTVGAGGEKYGSYYTRYNRPRLVVELMGIAYVEQWQRAAATSLSFQSSQLGVVDVRGYDYLFQDLTLGTYDSVKTLMVRASQWKLEYSPFALTVKLSELPATEGPIVFDLHAIISSLEKEYGTVAYSTEVPSSLMILESNNRTTKARLLFNTIMVDKTGNQYRGNFLQARLMIGAAEKK
jgi:hypothetical protein